MSYVICLNNTCKWLFYSPYDKLKEIPLEKNFVVIIEFFLFLDSCLGKFQE